MTSLINKALITLNVGLNGTNKEDAKKVGTSDQNKIVLLENPRDHERTEYCLKLLMKCEESEKKLEARSPHASLAERAGQASNLEKVAEQLSVLCSMSSSEKQEKESKTSRSASSVNSDNSASDSGKKLNVTDLIWRGKKRSVNGLLREAEIHRIFDNLIAILEPIHRKARYGKDEYVTASDGESTRRKAYFPAVLTLLKNLKDLPENRREEILHLFGATYLHLLESYRVGLDKAAEKEGINVAEPPFREYRENTLPDGLQHKKIA